MLTHSCKRVLCQFPCVGGRERRGTRGTGMRQLMFRRASPSVCCRRCLRDHAALRRMNPSVGNGRCFCPGGEGRFGVRRRTRRQWAVLQSAARWHNCVREVFVSFFFLSPPASAGDRFWTSGGTMAQMLMLRTAVRFHFFSSSAVAASFFTFLGFFRANLWLCRIIRSPARLYNL